MLADAVSDKLKMSKLAFPAIEPITIPTSFRLLRIGLYDRLYCLSRSREKLNASYFVI